MNDSALSFGDLSVDDLQMARRLVATAFAGEPFAYGMFGESAVGRFVGMANEYADWPNSPNPVTVAAMSETTLVGVALATRAGACHLCDDFDSSGEVGTTDAARIEHEFQLACRQAHLASGLPPHAHVQTVATEAFLRGSGLGRDLMVELLERLCRLGERCVVLECLTTRERFYERCGFGTIAEFADPGGPTLRSLLMRIDLAD